MERIFVSVASYRDTECQHTIKDLFEKADQPDRVFVGICWQYISEEDDDCFQIPSPRPDQTRIIHKDAREGKGACWARSLVQSLWQGEEYFFQIDAHSRFVQGWDTILLDMLKKCPPRSVLTSYPTSYEPPDKLGPKNVVTISAKDFDEKGLLAFSSSSTPEEQAPYELTPTFFLGAGLVFGPSEIIIECPYDPYIYFTGEEITLAIRLWTHGWNLYTPNRVTVYHDYTHRDTKPRHWQDHKLWVKLSDLACQRIRYLLENKPVEDEQSLQEIDKYSLGTVRTLQEYERLSGVEFSKQLINGKTSEELEAELPVAIRQDKVKKTFSDIWERNAWSCAESKSGPGSSLAQTEILRSHLAYVLKALDIRTLVDAGCGDVNWMQHISGMFDVYMGFDVADACVAENRTKFSSRKNHFFNTADLCSDTLPKADAIFCRDVLGHLSLPLALLALKKFKESGSRYLISTTFPRGKNDSIRTGSWQMIDLTAEPFNLPPPIILLDEQLPGFQKSLGVWPMQI